MKKLGFGCMRLPMMGGADGEVDKREFCRMVDTFLAEGFCYFDTAHGYLNGKSETALREGLTARYPRESYILTDKLTSFFFEKEDDILPLFEQQLEKTGVSYFDYYLLHALNGAYYEKFTRCNAFEIVKQLKEQGRVKHIGISFHDKPALLDRVLDEHPEIEVVQIQFNYADYENPSIESRVRGVPQTPKARHRDGTCQGRGTYPAAGGSEGGAGRRGNGKLRQLCRALRGFL